MTKLIFAMCASRTNGYQGFQSFAVQQCATLKPGKSYEQRTTKFSAMGSRNVTPITMNRMGRHAHESVAMQNGQQVQPEHYKVPDRRGVSLSEKRLASKPFTASSTYLHDFPAYDEVRRTVLHIPLGDYEKAFMAIVQDNDQQEEKIIQLSQVQNVLKLALGDTAISRVNDVFYSFLDRRGRVRDRISWDLFTRAVDYVNKLFEHELSHCKMPEPSSKTWGSSNFTEKQRNERLVHSSTPASSHQKDFGAYGDNPRDRPYIRKRGMASTTNDLNLESMRMTNQIPGYGGFLPRSLHSTQIEASANDQELLSTSSVALRLYHSDNVPGYTGHKPVDCTNYRGECRAGSDHCTTTGSSFKAHQ